MTLAIDINADVGEIPAALADGSEERLIRLVTSVNVACGGHAGTPATMARVVELARRHGVAVGAHPSYPDSEGFGRRALAMADADLEGAVASQVRALAEVVQAQGATLGHVKPHGALYNVAARDARVAAAIARALAGWRESVVLVGLAGAPVLDVWQRAGFRVAPEAFADRRYEPDGTLRSRREADALITNPEAAARQALAIVEEGHVVSVTGARVPVAARTLCVHGDTPGAAAILEAVRAALLARGIALARLG